MLNLGEVTITEETEGNGRFAEFASSLHGSGEKQAGIRPTLYVGLGGTGQRIAVYLKALLAVRGELPDWLRILAFDTADEPVVVGLEEGGTIALEPGTEFVNIGHVPVGRIIRHSHKQHAIAERFGESLRQLPPTVLRHGAKQVRLLGLLALYWHFHQVEEHLRRAIWHLAGRDTGRRTVVDSGQGVNVFIANSLCGGTGAGTFLDVAFLVRSLVEELGDLGDFCQITGLGVLPGAFPNVEGPGLQPNTVASLMELNYAMTRDDFHAIYPNGRVVEPASAPFNLYYVVDGVDERGRVWPGINAVCQLAARALYIQMGSQLGRKGENDFDNLDEVLGNVGEDGAGTFLGSVGLSICRFDARAVRRSCARHHAARLVREGWLKPADETAAAAETFWETAQLAADPLMASLSLDGQNVPLGVDLALPGNVRRLPPAQQAQETVTHVEEYRTARLESTFRTAIETRRSERSAHLAEELRRTVRGLAGDPEAGVLHAQAMLRDLRGRLKEARESLRQAQTELEGRIEHLDQDVHRCQKALLGAPVTGLLARSRRVKAAQQRYLQAATAAYRAHLSHQLGNAALQVLENLTRVQGDLSATLDRLSGRLQDGLRLLEQTVPLPEDGLLADLDLADPAYVAALYERHAPGLGDTAALCLKGEATLLDLADRPAVEVARWIERAAIQPFETLLSHDIEAALAERADEVSPEARRLWMLERATPSWNLDRSRMEDGGAGLVTVTVLGVPDEHDSLFAEQSEMLVSTQDESHIIALRATVGAPYTALQQFPAWKRAYEQMRGRRPLHVLPSFHTSTDVALQAFALGLVFKLIFTQGTWYYYRPVDRLDEPDQLAQGLHNAVTVFAAREGLAHEVMERVEKLIPAHMTTTQAIARLETYCAAGERGELIDDVDRALRKAARAYTDRLRQTLVASEGILE